MKRIVVLLAVLVLSTAAFAQIEQPVRWSYAAKKINANEAVVFLKATIDKNWHIYAQNPNGGGLNTSFTFNKSPYYVLVGKTLEPKPTVKFESAIGKNVEYFENSVVFQQKIRLRSARAKVVTGKLEFLACAKKCLPPEELEFAIPIGK